MPVRQVFIIGVLVLTACCTPKGGKPKIGTPEKGTRIECKTSHRVVDDPAKCEATEAK